MTISLKQTAFLCCLAMLFAGCDTTTPMEAKRAAPDALTQRAEPVETQSITIEGVSCTMSVYPPFEFSSTVEGDVAISCDGMVTSITVRAAMQRDGLRYSSTEETCTYSTWCEAEGSAYKSNGVWRTAGSGETSMHDFDWKTSSRSVYVY